MTPKSNIINEEAFGPGRFTRAAYKIREGGPHERALSFVAMHGDAVVASVRMTRIAAGDGRALLLGPLAVRPAFKNLGIGRKLVAIALEAAEKAGAPAVVLVGDEPYYGPLGFKQDPARPDIHAAPGRSRPASSRSSSRRARLRGSPAKSAMRTWRKAGSATPDLRILPVARLASVASVKTPGGCSHEPATARLRSSPAAAPGLARRRRARWPPGGAKVAILDLGIDRAEKVAADIGGIAAELRRRERRQAEAAIAEVGAAARRSRASWSIAPASRIAMKTLGKDGPHPLDIFRKVIEVNLIGTFNMIRLAADRHERARTARRRRARRHRQHRLRRRLDGQIGQAAYSASKGGVVGMTLPIARELARSGIRVMTIAPGIFRTPMLAGLPQEAQDSLGAAVPFPSRLGEPREYAALALPHHRKPDAERRDDPPRRRTSAWRRNSGRSMPVDASAHRKPGPLSGLSVVEMAGLGPAPLAALMLSEMGADVLRIERMHVSKPLSGPAPRIRSRPPRPLDPARRPQARRGARTRCCGLRKRPMC